MDYLKAFLVGGLLCVIGQILIDRTKLTPARILVAYVVAGVLLGAVGLYGGRVRRARHPDGRPDCLCRRDHGGRDLRPACQSHFQAEG